jgi:hypothetical protein
MVTHAGLLGRHKPFYPEQDVKLLNTTPQQNPLQKEQENKTWQEEKQSQLKSLLQE